MERICGGGSGCRVMLGDSGTVIVADTSTWTDGMTDCVKSRFSGVRIVVCQCSSSMSGFSVVIYPPPDSQSFCCKIILYVSVILSLCALVISWK